MTEEEIEILYWQGMSIEVRYVPEWSKSYTKAYGEPLGHLQLRTIEPANAPMPVSSTGYISEFLLDSEVLEFGGAVNFARAVLDAAARDDRWKDQEEDAKQFSLF